jgi:hypothetical protein
MGKDKKRFDERLQDTRNPKSDKVQYRRRKQEEKEADKELKDYDLRRNGPSS